MDKHGSIIIIEDDLDEQFIWEEVFKELGCPNNRKYFKDGLLALEYLSTTADLPFLIISDINLPKLDGMELRKKIQTDPELRVKCIPYVYFTTATNQQAAIDAYSGSAQGFFVKPDTVDGIKDTLTAIIEYWNRCAAPNDFRF